MFDKKHVLRHSGRNAKNSSDKGSKRWLDPIKFLQPKRRVCQRSMFHSDRTTTWFCAAPTLYRVRLWLRFRRTRRGTHLFSTAKTTQDLTCIWENWMFFQKLLGLLIVQHANVRIKKAQIESTKLGRGSDARLGRTVQTHLFVLCILNFCQRYAPFRLLRRTKLSWPDSWPMRHG